MTYTGQQVDELVLRFEKNCKRQIAVRSQVVKVRVAEADLLKTAEEARDLFQLAVQGDRNHLEDVFGGEGQQRFHRFRIAMDSVDLTDMYTSDQRWGHLRDAMNTIETVLKDMGLWESIQRSRLVESMRLGTPRSSDSLPGRVMLPYAAVIDLLGEEALIMEPNDQDPVSDSPAKDSSTPSSLPSGMRCGTPRSPDNLACLVGLPYATVIDLLGERDVLMDPIEHDPVSDSPAKGNATPSGMRCGTPRSPDSWPGLEGLVVIDLLGERAVIMEPIEHDPVSDSPAKEDDTPLFEQPKSQCLQPSPRQTMNPCPPEQQMPDSSSPEQGEVSTAHGREPEDNGEESEHPESPSPQPVRAPAPIVTLVIPEKCEVASPTLPQECCQKKGPSVVWRTGLPTTHRPSHLLPQPAEMATASRSPSPRRSSAPFAGVPTHLLPQPTEMATPSRSPSPRRSSAPFTGMPTHLLPQPTEMATASRSPSPRRSSAPFTGVPKEALACDSVMHPNASLRHLSPVVEMATASRAPSPRRSSAPFTGVPFEALACGSVMHPNASLRHLSPVAEALPASPRQRMPTLLEQSTGSQALKRRPFMPEAVGPSSMPVEMFAPPRKMMNPRRGYEPRQPLLAEQAHGPKEMLAPPR